jgi:hypothetical protein
METRKEMILPNLGYCPGIYLQSSKKIIEMVVRIVSIPTNNQNGYLPNTTG